VAAETSGNRLFTGFPHQAYAAVVPRSKGGWTAVRMGRQGRSGGRLSRLPRPPPDRSAPWRRRRRPAGWVPTPGRPPGSKVRRPAARY